MKPNRNNIFAYLGVLAGVLAIIFAFVMFNTGSIRSLSTGTFTAYNYYGGDAYTGIQQASADAARNAKNLSEITAAGLSHISVGIGAILLVLGLALLGSSGRQLLEISRDAKALPESPSVTKPEPAAPVATDGKGEYVVEEAAEIAAGEDAE